MMTSEFNKTFLGDKKMKKRKQSKPNESQLTVPTPLWLQRRMLKNLQLAARCKVSPVRAQRTSEILKALHADSKPRTESVSEGHAGVASPIPEVNFGWASRIRRFASTVFLKMHSVFSVQRHALSSAQAR